MLMGISGGSPWHHSIRHTQAPTCTPANVVMAQGFSGGFFLPAQRSIHCKGGFFATDASAQRPQPHQQKPAEGKANAGHNSSSAIVGRDPPAGRRGSRHVYDEEDDDDEDVVNDSDVYVSGMRNKPNPSQVNDSPGNLHSAAAATRSSSLRFIRPRHEKVCQVLKFCLRLVS